MGLSSPVPASQGLSLAWPCWASPEKQHRSARVALSGQCQQAGWQGAGSRWLYGEDESGSTCPRGNHQPLDASVLRQRLELGISHTPSDSTCSQGHSGVRFLALKSALPCSLFLSDFIQGESAVTQEEGRPGLGRDSLGLGGVGRQ